MNTAAHDLPEDSDLITCDSIAGFLKAARENPEGWFFLKRNIDRIGTEGAKSLAQRPELERVVFLELHTSSMGDEGVAALIASEYLGNVRTLDVSGNELTRVGAESIASSTGLKRVEKLLIEYNDIGPEGAVALSRAEHLSTLQEIRLRNTNIGDEGVIALATSETLTEMRGIYAFIRVGVTEAGYRVVAMSRCDRTCRRYCMEELSMKTLKSLAKEHGLKRYSKLKKPELIEALLEVELDA